MSFSILYEASRGEWGEKEKEQSWVVWVRITVVGQRKADQTLFLVASPSPSPLAPCWRNPDFVQVPTFPHKALHLEKVTFYPAVGMGLIGLLLVPSPLSSC